MNNMDVGRVDPWVFLYLEHKKGQVFLEHGFKLSEISF